jgi:hypothetical protein
LAIVHVKRRGLGREQLLLARRRCKRLLLLGLKSIKVLLLSRSGWAKGQLLLWVVHSVGWAGLCGYGVRRRLTVYEREERAE